MSADAPCFDCGVDTLPTDWPDRAEFYMVKDEVWGGVFRREGGGYYLCVGCLEHRLGRRLEPSDFTDCHLNDLDEADNPRWAWSYRTQRLTSRLMGLAS